MYFYRSKIVFVTMDVGASAVTFVALAFQLASGLKKGYDFWQSIDEAPAAVRAISRELELLSAVLDGLASSSGARGGGDAVEVMNVLETCR